MYICIYLYIYIWGGDDYNNKFSYKKSLFPCSENFYSLSNFQTSQAVVLTTVIMLYITSYFQNSDYIFHRVGFC